MEEEHILTVQRFLLAKAAVGILNDAAEWERLHSEKYSLTCLCKNNEITMRNHWWRFSCKYRAPSRSRGCTDYEIIVFCQGPSELKKVWSSKAKAAVKYLKSQYKKRTQKKKIGILQGTKVTRTRLQSDKKLEKLIKGVGQRVRVTFVKVTSAVLHITHSEQRRERTE